MLTEMLDLTDTFPLLRCELEKLLHPDLLLVRRIVLIALFHRMPIPRSLQKIVEYEFSGVTYKSQAAMRNELRFTSRALCFSVYSRIGVIDLCRWPIWAKFLAASGR